MMAILILIIVFVRYLFLCVSVSPYVEKYTMDSHLLETLWTVIPMVVLVFIAFPSLYLLYLIEEISSPVLRVKVVGHQWYWEYQYTTSDLSPSFDSYLVSERVLPQYHNLDVDCRLVLPTSINILFLITSADVLHSWAVPSLGVKMDAIPGRLNYVTRRSLFSGVYYGQCREICGSNHRFMPVVLEFIHIKEFCSHLLRGDV